MHMTEDRSILGASQAAVLVGAVVQIHQRYLLVREAKAVCRGKWNLPGGHLQPGESIMAGAIREVLEETGHKIKLTGLYSLINCVSPHGTLILIPFAAKSLGLYGQPDPIEILETALFTRDQIAAMSDQLRFPELITDLLSQVEHGPLLPLNALRVYQ